MHRGIGTNNQDARVDGQAGHILPQRDDVESESTQDGSTRHLDIQPILPIDQGQVPDFIDTQGLEAVVEDGELFVIR
jgi:hypothetical protein